MSCKRKDGKPTNYGDDVCEICGTVYAKTGSTSKYCNKCRAIKLKNYQKFKQKRRLANPIYKQYRVILQSKSLKINRENYFSLLGDKCWICERQLNKKNWSKHHTNYNKSLIILVCRSCHGWLHGRQSYNKIFYDKYGKDIAPLKFAKCVVAAYKKAVPVLKAVNVKQDFIQWKKDNGYD